MTIAYRSTELPAVNMLLLPSPSKEEEEEEEETSQAKEMITTADDLPMDLLHTIQKHLPIDDYLRFPAVCRSWRSASTAQTCSSLDDQTPWLFTLRYSSRSSSFWAFRPSLDNDRPGKCHRIPIPRESSHLQDHYIISSIGPWLVLRRIKMDNLCLLNPFSWIQISLPSAPPPFYSFKKVVADEGLNILVAVRLSFFCSGLSYVRLGSSERGGCSWINLSDENYLDVVPYKDRLFFALRSDYKMEVLDFSSNNRVDILDTSLNLVQVRYFTETEKYYYYSHGHHLIVSSNNLYLVCWSPMKWGDLKTAWVFVYKMSLLDDGTKRVWEEAESPGSRAFFLGKNQSMSLSAVDYPGLKAYCIYLLSNFKRAHKAEDDEEYNADGYALDFDYNCIYNMRDKSWERLYGWDEECHHRFHDWDTTWITPRFITS